MDGNVYSYAANMWNSYSEGFQPPALDLQNYMPTNREHFQREQGKNPLAPSSPYVFLNYPEESHHHHHHHPHNHHHDINRGQWNFPTWSKVKSGPEFIPHVLPKRSQEKLFSKETNMGMAVVHAGAPTLNIPPAGGFCAPDLSERTMDDLHSFGQHLEPQEHVNGSTLSPAPNTTLQAPAQPSVSANRNTTRKNPTPRKRKERPKKEEQPKKKRTRDEEAWARNIRKKARSKGEAYISVMGKTIRARSVKPVDCSKCKFNCPTRVSEEERQLLFNEYWSLETYKEKVEFIAGCVHEFAPLRPVSGRRAFSRRYMLKVKGKEERVCKEFFVSTFDVSESTIVTYMGKKRKGSDAIADLRGKQTPSNKTPSDTVKTIREHILSQTGLQGELSRSPSEDAKNVKKLYVNYHSECEMENRKPASISVYRKIFSEVHKGKTDSPIELPPETVLQQIPNKKLKPGIDDTSSSTDIGLTPSSPEANSPGPPPSTAELITVNSTSLNENPSPFDLGLMPYQGGMDQQVSDSSMDRRICSLNIPNTVYQQHEHRLQEQQHQQLLQQQHNVKSMYSVPFHSDVTGPAFEKTHVNHVMPLSWDSNRMGNIPIEQKLGFDSATFPTQNSLVGQGTSSALSSSLFNYQISGPSSSSTQGHQASTSNFNYDPQQYQPLCQGTLTTKRKKSGGGAGHRKKPKESKPKKEVKKRARDEASWGRNVRKRLRFKGEAYLSVKGKQVEAKLVRKVDCSKCKFKCTSRITEEQRTEFNKDYWDQDTYKKKIAYITKRVQTYTPRRKMTGRRAFSRKYIFYVNGKEERVCKDFFKATLHISESTIATALEKTRKGESAIIDLRGKHKPVNKTTEDTLQNIRELIIYLTGMRPHRSNNNARLGSEYRDMNRLYQVYKYDREKKGKKVASLGIFRGVLINEFCFRSAGNTKTKKVEPKGDNILKTCATALSESATVFPTMIPAHISSPACTGGIHLNSSSSQPSFNMTTQPIRQTLELSGVNIPMSRPSM